MRSIFTATLSRMGAALLTEEAMSKRNGQRRFVTYVLVAMAYTVITVLLLKQL